MFNNKKLWVLIVLLVANQGLFGMKKQRAIDLEQVLEQAKREMAGEQKAAAEAQALKELQGGLSQGRRSFYDSEHRAVIMNTLRREVILNNVLSPQQKLEEVKRNFGLLIQFAQRQQLIQTEETLNRDRQRLINEIFKLE